MCVAVSCDGMLCDYCAEFFVEERIVDSLSDAE